MQYYVKKDYTIYGPLSEENIRIMLAHETLDVEDEFSSDKKDWKKISEEPNLQISADQRLVDILSPDCRKESAEPEVPNSTSNKREESENSEKKADNNLEKYMPSTEKNKPLLSLILFKWGNRLIMSLSVLLIFTAVCIHFSKGAVNKRNELQSLDFLALQGKKISKFIGEKNTNFIANFARGIKEVFTWSDPNGEGTYLVAEEYFWGYSGEINDNIANFYYELSAEKNYKDSKNIVTFYGFYRFYRCCVLEKSFYTILGIGIALFLISFIINLLVHLYSEKEIKYIVINQKAA